MKTTLITDEQTNFVYFSDLLPIRYPAFWDNLMRVLEEKNIAHALLPKTRDIWCRDYMPIQVEKNYFVQFRYEPSYLMKSASGRLSITNVSDVCQAIGIKSVKSDIKIDGGNLVKLTDRIIMTRRVLTENPDYTEERLLDEIKALLKVRHIVLLPEVPDDSFGHSDGMARAVGGGLPETVFCSDFTREPGDFSKNVGIQLSAAGLTTIRLVYAPYDNKTNMDACGVYINYLQVGKTVIYPVFGIKNDATACRVFEKYFGDNAISLNCKRIAKDGGVLNCISWNIQC